MGGGIPTKKVREWMNVQDVKDGRSKCLDDYEFTEMICSNCGKKNKYSQKELDLVFPYSRETLLCKHCNHTLSVCSGAL